MFFVILDKIPQRGRSDVCDWGSTEDKHNVNIIYYKAILTYVY